MSNRKIIIKKSRENVERRKPAVSEWWITSLHIMDAFPRTRRGTSGTRRDRPI